MGGCYENSVDKRVMIWLNARGGIGLPFQIVSSGLLLKRGGRFFLDYQRITGVQSQRRLGRHEAVTGGFIL